MDRERLPRVVLDWMPKGRSSGRVGGVKKTIEKDLVVLGTNIVDVRCTLKTQDALGSEKMASFY